MKLLQRTSQYYLISSLLVFLAIGVGLVVALRYTLNYATDESLKLTRSNLTHHLAGVEDLEPTLYITDEIVELRPVKEVSSYERWQDTMILDERGEQTTEAEPFRKYTYDEVVRGQAYRVSISLSKVENRDLIESVVGVVVVGLLLLLLAINLLNRYLAYRIWKPFYTTVGKIKAFSVQRGVAPTFDQSDIEEFDTLNRSLETMTVQLSREYDTLRRFTENASHELQTPLAIIRNQVDMLLREETRSRNDYVVIERISEAVTRLGKLNQSLLLLTKIERDQYPAAEWIDLVPLIQRKLDQLEPALEKKRITLSTTLLPLSIFLPVALTDVLLNNLLGNAINHNLPYGQLEVRSGNRQLSITNSGKALTRPAGSMFERFAHGTSGGTSLGLGLAIVKEVCDRFGFTIRYVAEEETHKVELHF